MEDGASETNVWLDQLLRGLNQAYWECHWWTWDRRKFPVNQEGIAKMRARLQEAGIALDWLEEHACTTCGTTSAS